MGAMKGMAMREKEEVARWTESIEREGPYDHWFALYRL